METFMMLVLFFICYIPALIILAITPYITRKTESFGVSIPGEEHMNSEVVRIRKKYRNRTLIYGGVLSAFALIFTLVVSSDVVYLLLPAGTIMLMLIAFIFYLDGHKQMKELKAKENWMAVKKQLIVVDMGFRSKRVMASSVWFVVYILVILATACIGFAMYREIPDRIPMHWNINGVADRWADKSYRTILWGPFVQLFLTVVMLYSYWIIGKSKQLIDSSDAEKSAERNRIFRYRWSVFIIAIGLVLIVMIGFMQFFSYGFIKSSQLMVWVPMALGLGIVAASIILSITTGQGGSRIKGKKIRSGEKAENELVNRDDDKYWKLGLFYFNPDDPAFIVEKRFGVGWTNNWARPVSWIIVLGVIAVTAIFIIGSATLF